MSDRILFVTKGGERCDDGFPYVLELARTLQAGIDVLILYPERIMTDFEDVMAAVAFAEAGDFETVRNLMEGQKKEMIQQCERKISEILKKADETSVPLSWKTATGDVAQMVKEYLKNRPGIDMVLLSPNLSENNKHLDIRKLIRNISKPIVNISGPMGAEI
jgi:hypothetical protein